MDERLRERVVECLYRQAVRLLGAAQPWHPDVDAAYRANAEQDADAVLAELADVLVLAGRAEGYRQTLERVQVYARDWQKVSRPPREVLIDIDCEVSGALAARDGDGQG